MNVNFILFIVLLILTIIAIYYEYIHMKDDGIYKKLAQIEENSSINEIQEATERGIWDLEKSVIWRRTIMAVFLFFILSYSIILSLQISFGNSLVTNVQNYPWVIIVLLAFIVFYMIQSFFLYHHLSIITKQINKNIKALIKK